MVVGYHHFRKPPYITLLSSSSAMFKESLSLIEFSKTYSISFHNLRLVAVKLQWIC